MERRTEVKTYQVDYICDDCESGVMAFTGRTLLSHPPQYEHQCTQCGMTRYFRGVTYPKIVYETQRLVAEPSDPGAHTHDRSD
jgi:hypothetical protein